MKFVQPLIFGLLIFAAVPASADFPKVKQQWQRFAIPLDWDPIKKFYDFESLSNVRDYSTKSFFKRSMTNFWNAAPDDYLKKQGSISNFPGAWLNGKITFQIGIWRRTRRVCRWDAAVNQYLLTLSDWLYDWAFLISLHIFSVAFYFSTFSHIH